MADDEKQKPEGEKQKPEGPDKDGAGQGQGDSGQGQGNGQSASGNDAGGKDETPKKTAEEMRNEITASLGNFFNKDNPAWEWFNNLTKQLRDNLPENVLPEVQTIFSETGKKLDGIDKDASLAQKAKQGFDILQSTTKNLSGLAEKHLGKAEGKDKDGNVTERSGTGMNAGLLGAAAVMGVVGQKIATSKDGEEVGGARKLFGRVLQVAAAAVAALGIGGFAKGKSGTQLITDWRSRTANESSQGASQGRT